MTAQVVALALAAAAAVVVSYPLLSTLAATAVVAVVTAGRIVARRVERSTLRVDVPGVPVEVTVARTARD